MGENRRGNLMILGTTFQTFSPAVRRKISRGRPAIAPQDPPPVPHIFASNQACQLLSSLKTPQSTIHHPISIRRRIPLAPRTRIRRPLQRSKSNTQSPLPRILSRTSQRHEDCLRSRYTQRLGELSARVRGTSQRRDTEN